MKTRSGTRVLTFVVFLAMVALGVYVVAHYRFAVAPASRQGGTLSEAALSAKDLASGASASHLVSGASVAAVASDTSSMAAAIGGSASASASGSSPSDYFAQAALQQQQAQSKEASQLQSVADDTQASSIARQDAEESLIALDQEVAAQSQADLVLEAKGYPQALVLINGQGAVVVVDAPSFNATDAARIGQAVAEIAGIDPAEVQIIPRS